jgi:hypothetical protein
MNQFLKVTPSKLILTILIALLPAAVNTFVSLAGPLPDQASLTLRITSYIEMIIFSPLLPIRVLLISLVGNSPIFYIYYIAAMIFYSYILVSAIKIIHTILKQKTSGTY